MRKSFFYALAFICSMSLFTACGDDDGPMIPATDLNSTFGKDVNTQLVLKYGDAPLVGKQVKVETTDSKTATITLTDVIPGEAETVIDNVQLIEGDGEYMFSGSIDDTKSAYSVRIDYSGSVKKGYLTLNLTVAMPDTKGWARTYDLGSVRWGEVTTWKFRPPNLVENTINTLAASSIYYAAEVQKPVYDKEVYPTMMDFIQKAVGPASNFVNMFPMMGRSLGGAMLYQVLQTVTLNADGNITASYSSEATTFNMDWAASFIISDTVQKLTAGRQWQPSPKNLAHWFEKDGKLYVKLNIPAIFLQAMPDDGQSGNERLMGMISQILSIKDVATIKMLLAAASVVEGMEMLSILGDLQDETLGMLLDWMQNGIPLNIETKDGHTYIYLNKEVFSQLIAEFPVLIPYVKKANLGGQGDYLARILENVVIGWEYVDELNIGLDLIAR